MVTGEQVFHGDSVGFLKNLPPPILKMSLYGQHPELLRGEVGVMVRIGVRKQEVGAPSRFRFWLVVKVPALD